MEEPIVAPAMTDCSRPWPIRISLYESLIYDPPVRICRPRATALYRRPSYNIVFSMSFFKRGKKADYTKWYKINVNTESNVKLENEMLEIQPFWGGEVPKFASFEALGGDIYCFGGKGLCDYGRSSMNVYKLSTNFPTDRLFRMPSMKISRIHPHSLVLDGKIYVLAGHGVYGRRPGRNGKLDFGEVPVVEVYEPTTGDWKTLPPPPFPIETDYICAALENPSRILVASLAETDEPTLVFYQYDVKQGCWQMLEKPERNLHYKCPIRHGGKAITVGNTLYWVTYDTKLLAYDVHQDEWLLGNLKGLGISFLEFEYDEYCPFSLIHLAGLRFAMVQCVYDNKVEVQCVIVDVHPKPERLEISVVSVHKFKTERNSLVHSCFLV
ncbi:uncharacterized protein LOC132162536 isoform X2 [Corylus avellana]|nr:uncharacterized protein LOC132162536 isoform X2 [Corylus avellana]